MQTNTSLVLVMPFLQARSYSVTLSHLFNPLSPDTAMWSFKTYAMGQTMKDGTWLLPANERDSSSNYAGPATYIHFVMAQATTNLGTPFFDAVNAELRVVFTAYPRPVNSGQYLLLYSPPGYEFLDRTFNPGDGFPLISGTVYSINTPQARAVYVVQILTRILNGQTMKFTVRVRTPSTPDDLAVWDQTHTPSWLLMACNDPVNVADQVCYNPTASNDDLFPGFKLKASFGTASVTPQANGVAPRTSVTVTVDISPQASLSSLLSDGSVYVRLRAPLGFDFPLGCLAVTPNPVFEACFGLGRIAVLLVRNGLLPAGASSLRLSVTNAGMTPSEASEGGVGNQWVLESFVDLVSEDQVVVADSALARQRSTVQGYEIRVLLQATVGGNTQLGATTTVLVWFVATYFLDVGGVVELHAPPSYELRCTLRAQLEVIEAMLRQGEAPKHGQWP
ncbi:unnamed protein product [Polarella glacialis]|uniref:Uncharacterized protein n=1 Tax=Polarella glacialis TaxID=89957 RepID=A0A813LB06_POLGL|nr:unnamed protein product [Polarella glacialis]